MQNKKRIYIALLIVLLIVVFAYAAYSLRVPQSILQKPPGKQTIDTLGYKQNNPGNIRNSGAAFDGEKQSPNAFKAFTSMAWGYRAMAVLLYTYYSKYGDNTIRKLITRYAPPNENSTGNYVSFVSQFTGINADKPLTKSSFTQLLFMPEPEIKKVIRAISTKEISWVNEIELNKGYTEFLNDKL